MTNHARSVSLCAMSLLLSLALFSGSAFGQQSADVIFHNGKILTVDNNFTVAQAIAVRGNRIAAVGANQDVLAMRGPGTQVVDLKGRTVVPGLIDTHRHIYGAAEGSYGETWTRICGAATPSTGRASGRSRTC